ncbi:hypothetical protein GC163_15630 [bacterium]|nr:hypothetical protein [bacterium]
MSTGGGDPKRPQQRPMAGGQPAAGGQVPLPKAQRPGATPGQIPVVTAGPVAAPAPQAQAWQGQPTMPTGQPQAYANAQPAAPPPTMAKSLTSRALGGDRQAIETMFRQFTPPDETYYAVDYLGFEGLWIFGTHSFGALTDRRVAAMRMTFWGEVVYQDGFLESINSNVFYQPSKLWLYISLISVAFTHISGWIATIMMAMDYEDSRERLLTILVGTVVWAVFGFISSLIAIKWFHWFKKSGAAFIIKEGVTVFIFTDRSRMSLANDLFRRLCFLREQRIKQVAVN